MQFLLGTGATTTAQINLILQLLMGVALLLGMWLARRKRFAAHGICQSAVLLLNLALIARIMWRSFHAQVLPQIPGGLHDPYYWVPAIHAVLGTAAELLGLYIALVAGTPLLPERLRFRKWKRWMRVELGLWWAVILLGVGTYFIWYAPARAKERAAQAEPAKIEVMVSNFSFAPQTITVPAGATVEWTDEAGRHTVEADDGSFKSATMVAGDHFSFTFSKAGAYPYHCMFHGESGGKDMAGSVVVH
jgi:plastocyanin/fumarate reductase subunit D